MKLTRRRWVRNTRNARVSSGASRAKALWGFVDDGASGLWRAGTDAGVDASLVGATSQWVWTVGVESALWATARVRVPLVVWGAAARPHPPPRSADGVSATGRRGAGRARASWRFCWAKVKKYVRILCVRLYYKFCHSLKILLEIKRVNKWKTKNAKYLFVWAWNFMLKIPPPPAFHPAATPEFMNVTT